MQLGVFSLEMCSRHHLPHDGGNFKCNLHKRLLNRSQDSFRQIQLLVFMQKAPVLCHALDFNLHNILVGRNSVCNLQLIKATSFRETRPYPPVYEHTLRQLFFSGGWGKETVFPETQGCQLFQSCFRRHDLRKILASLLINVDSVQRFSLAELNSLLY